MKLLRDASLLYIILFFAGYGAYILPFVIIISGLYLTGVIG
jgi:hypothetical protein